MRKSQNFVYDLACTPNTTGPTGVSPTQLKALSQAHILLPTSTCINNNAYTQLFQSIDTGPFLLTAIDPAAENQLVHLDQHITNGRMLTEQDTVQKNKNLPVPYYQVPLLLQEQLQGQTTLHVAVKRLTSQAIDPQQVINRGGVNYLTHLPGQQTILSQDAPTIQNSLINVSKKGYVPELYWDGHSWQTIYNEQIVQKMPFLYQPSGLTYQATSAPNDQITSAYTLVPAPDQSIPEGTQKTETFSPELTPSQQQGPEVSFRTLTPTQMPKANQSIKYETQFVGQFTNTSISNQFSNPLNWLPETTYASQPVQQRYDAQGKPVSPTPLYPTTDPSGFLQQPPVALTTLSAAQHIMGNDCISVIRVRVNGVNSANQASWNKVAQIAQQIRLRTGLQVLVTLGSSPQPTLIYVPGLPTGQHGTTQPIAPLGWIQDSWIYVGASVLYLAQLGSTRFLFLGVILFVCLGYLSVTLSALVTSQRKEFAILSALGWRPWQSVRLFIGQVLSLALLGGILGIGNALLLALLLGAIPIALVVIWTLPVILLLALLSILYPLWLVWRIRPAEALRTGVIVTKQRESRLFGVRLLSFVSPLVILSLRNITRSRIRTIIAIGSIFFSALLLTILCSGLLAFRQTLQGTLLGSYVVFETQLPQIAGALFAVILTFLSVADLLLLQVRERQQEIGLLRAVGWRPVFVRRMFMQEGLLFALCGAVPGAIVALAILMIQHSALGILPPLLIACGSLLGMFVLCALATIPAIRVAERMQVVEVLRAE